MFVPLVNDPFPTGPSPDRESGGKEIIVLEDDDVPSVSFFTFCKEMLDKYEQDPRITMIAGFNNEEITPGVPYDYFFASTFSIWGWASCCILNLSSRKV